METVDLGRIVGVSIPQAVWIACNIFISNATVVSVEVSIPQAVWIACNKEYVRLTPFLDVFQYRKRYGLHAISPR